MTGLHRAAKTHLPSLRRRLFEDARREAIARRYAAMIVGSRLQIRKRYSGPYEVRREWIELGNVQEPIVLVVYADRSKAMRALAAYRKLDRQAVKTSTAIQARAA